MEDDRIWFINLGWKSFTLKADNEAPPVCSLAIKLDEILPVIVEGSLGFVGF